MRKFISIAMVIFGLLMLVTGITKLFPPFNATTHPGHIINSFIFALLVVVHTWLNRMSIFRYFTKLGWGWLPVVLGIAVVLWVGIGLPIIAS